MERVRDYDAHSNRVLKKGNLRFGKDNSLPSNVCQFRFLQINHIKHARTAPQTFTYLRIPLSPPQDSSMVSTEFGITQSIPTRTVHSWIQPDRINQHHTAWTAQQGCQQWMGAVVGGECGFLTSSSTVICRESAIPTILNQLTIYIDLFFLSISHIDFFCDLP